MIIVSVLLFPVMPHYFAGLLSLWTTGDKIVLQIVELYIRVNIFAIGMNMMKSMVL